MADNYLQFSEVVARLKKKEEAWLTKQLQPIRVFADKEYPEDAVPAELADKDADWTGVRFLRDNTDHDPDWDVLGFEYSFHDDNDHGGWGRHLWVYAEEAAMPTTRRGWCKSFSKSSGPTSAGRSPTPPLARSPARANLAAGRCLSRPTKSVARRLQFHRGPAGSLPTEGGGLCLCVGRHNHVPFRVQVRSGDTACLRHRASREPRGCRIL